jgi:aspartyl-tRNA(Asn)/glutamyl-tRNA(Gln) amidotransferase subunit A
MSEIVELTAAAAAERVRAGDLSPAELWSAYRGRAAADSLNAFLWLADEDAPKVRDDAPLGGVPLAVKDLFCTEGVPSAAA